MTNLVLTRHGESVWNKQNLFTGFKDVELTEQGILEAKQAGLEIKEKNIRFDAVSPQLLNAPTQRLNSFLKNLRSTLILLQK